MRWCSRSVWLNLMTKLACIKLLLVYGKNSDFHCQFVTRYIESLSHRCGCKGIWYIRACYALLLNIRVMSLYASRFGEPAKYFQINTVLLANINMDRFPINRLGKSENNICNSHLKGHARMSAPIALITT